MILNLVQSGRRNLDVRAFGHTCAVTTARACASHCPGVPGAWQGTARLSCSVAFVQLYNSNLLIDGPRASWAQQTLQSDNFPNAHICLINLWQSCTMGPLKGIRSEAHKMEKVCLAGDAGALRSQLLRGSSPCNQLAFPLHAACYASSFECVQLLLEYQADVNLQDNDGARPLSLACEAGCLPIVQLLCSYGARRQHVREIAGGLFAEEAASEHPHVVQWLKASRDWVSSTCLWAWLHEHMCRERVHLQKRMRA
eukprot:6210159-Pleurochrysis_carterae.AAC.2